MSENPTARFAPSATCYELYENFQIELQELKKQISTKDTIEQLPQGETQKIVESSSNIAGYRYIKELVLSKIDLVSDIMENMFTKLTNLMNDASKDKDAYSLKQKVEEQNEIIFQLKEEGVQIRTQLGQQKASHKLKKKQLKNQIAQLSSDLNEQRSLMQNFQEEVIGLEKRKVNRLEKWFVRLLEKIELDLVEQQNQKLIAVIEKVRNSRKNKPWKRIISDQIAANLLQNNLLTCRGGFVNGTCSSQINKGDEQLAMQSDAITSNLNDQGVMYSDFDDEDFSNIGTNNAPFSALKPQSFDKSINQAFIFSDGRNSDASNKIIPNGNTSNQLIPINLPFTFKESDQAKEQLDNPQNNFNILNLAELDSEKVNNFLKLNKLDLSVSQLEQEVLNLFQKTDRSTTNTHLNLKDVQLEDILNVTQQNNSISLELDFNKECKMNNSSKQANNNNNSLEKLLNSFSNSLSKKLSQKMKIKELKDNFPQELSPISSAQGKSQNNSINLNFTSVEQQHGFKNNIINNSIINSGSNINNNNNLSNINNSNILNNNMSIIQSNSNLLLSFIKGANKQENRKLCNNTMSNNTDLFILKEIADSESKEDAGKDILQMLSASVNTFNTTKNIQEFQKKLAQNSQPQDQQESFQDSSQDLSKDENKLNEAVFETDNSVNLQSSFNLNDENIQSFVNLKSKNQKFNKLDKTNNDKNIFNSSFMNSSQINNQTYQQDKKSQDSCSILADLQFEQKQSKQSNSFTNINDSKNSNNKNFHKKSVSQNIPKLDLSGISIQNNNHNTTNIQSNINLNNSMILNDQISESPIQTEKNQTTKNLRYEEEQTERKNNKVQQESSLKEQNDLLQNQQDKFEMKKNKNQLILNDSPSSFNTQSDFKCDANNSFLTDKQNIEQQQQQQQQQQYIKNNMFIDDFNGINISDSKLPQLKEEKIEKQFKNKNEKGLQKQNQQEQIILQLNQNCKINSQQNLQFYKQDYLQANQNDFDKCNANIAQNMQDAKLKPNQSKLGLFIDSFNELFNTQNNIHTQVDTPKVAFDTFNNSLAPNHDDYSNIKQEITNYPTIEDNQISDQKLICSQNVLGNFLENQKRNLYQTDYQTKSNTPKNISQPQFGIQQNNQTTEKLFIINKNDDQIFKLKTQIQSVQNESQQYEEGLTQKYEQLSKPNKLQTQQNMQNNLNKIQNNYFTSSNNQEQQAGKSQMQQQIENKQAQEASIQKNIQSLFSRKRVISDHEKVKKDFEQVLNENTIKEKSIDSIISLQQNTKNKKVSLHNHQTAYQQNTNKQIYDKAKQSDHQTNYLIDNRDLNELNKDLHIAKLGNISSNLNNNISQYEQQVSEYQEQSQMLQNCEEHLKILNAEQRKRATTTDDGTQKIKFSNEDTNKLKKQIVNFTKKKMIENEFKINKSLLQDNDIYRSKQYQNNDSIKQIPQDSNIQQEFKKKENDFYVPMQYYLPQKQYKVLQNKQLGINKSMEHCVNNGVKINKFKQENLTPSNNSGSNYFLSQNSQLSRIEQSKRLHMKQLSNNFQVGLTNNVNNSFTVPSQIQQINSSQIQYKDNSMGNVISKLQGNNEEQIYSSNNLPFQNEFNNQKQTFQSKNNHSIIENNSSNNQELRINLNNISFEGSNNQDAIKKISGNGIEKKKPMRATPLNQPIMDLSTVNNPPEFQIIKCQPLSTPNVPSRHTNFSNKTKIVHIKQTENNLKNDFKKLQINQQSSPKNIFYYNNKENITDMNIQIDKITNDHSYADYSVNLQGVSPSQILCKPSSSSGQKKCIIENNNFSQNILQDQTNVIQNLGQQYKVVSKKVQQQNSINIQPQQQKQQQISVTMRHPSRKKNLSTSNASGLINPQSNMMKNQQNFRTLNHQQHEEYEKLLKQEFKSQQLKHIQNNK
ncbi:hypothetical protein ABPG72_001984 [Tetrahymena utriculariae]